MKIRKTSSGTSYSLKFAANHSTHHWILAINTCTSLTINKGVLHIGLITFICKSVVIINTISILVIFTEYTIGLNLTALIIHSPSTDIQ